jgi:hypothetical protein
MPMKQASVVFVAAAVVAAAALARAQPAPLPPYQPPDQGSGSAAPPADAGSGSAAPFRIDGADGLSPEERAALRAAQAAPTPRVAPEPPKHPDPAIAMPTVLTIPTGWLLPAAVLYSRQAIDTGGGVTSDNRVGLGDVAEFGVATTDEVRERRMPGDKPERIQPYVTASFRLGVAEDRLFANQPGITLGFRKSFERNHDNEKTRIAELTLVASKHLGDRAAIHVGGAFWDASMQQETEGSPEVTLHGFDDVKHQIRAFGGLEARPLPKSEILIDLGWAPEFCYQCTGKDQIRLRPQLSWGVRYEVADWLNIESGVRVPDIGDANLLDAQIFGQLTFTSWALHHAVEGLKK